MKWEIIKILVFYSKALYWLWCLNTWFFCRTQFANVCLSVCLSKWNWSVSSFMMSLSSLSVRVMLSTSHNELETLPLKTSLLNCFVKNIQAVYWLNQLLCDHGQVTISWWIIVDKYKNEDNSTYIIEILWRINEIMPVNNLANNLAFNTK